MDRLFVRNATGLVREVSKWDALIMNSLGMNVALGAVFLLLQAPGNFPGGSMLLAIVIGTLVMAFTLLWVYAEFSAAMPRSGGDYVFVSRTLHPVVGWLLSWSQGMWLIFFWIGFNAWFALTFAVPVTFTTIGAVTGHTGFINASNSLLAQHTVAGITTQWWVIVFGALLTFGFCAVLIYGSQSYWRLQKWLFGLAGLSLVLVAGLLLFRGGQIAQSWNQFASANKGLAYENVISTAKVRRLRRHQGLQPDGDDPDAAVGLLRRRLRPGLGPDRRRGEAGQPHAVLRDGRRRPDQRPGPRADRAALPAHRRQRVGQQPVVPQQHRARQARTAGRRCPPSIVLMGSMLTDSVPILLLIGVGFILWALMGTPLSTLQATRYMLAWSLDRTVPKQLGEVNDRYHTPVKAILLCGVTGVVALIALVRIPQASLLGALLAQIVAFIVVSIAGIVFPYRLPQIWEGGGGRRILGVPAVTLAGIGGVIALGGLMIMFIFNDTVNATFAVTRGISLKFMIGVIVVGAIWYAAAWALNKRRGVDLALAYREIPPE